MERQIVVEKEVDLGNRCSTISYFERGMLEGLEGTILWVRPGFERYGEVAKRLKELQLPMEFESIAEYSDNWKTVKVLGRHEEQRVKPGKILSADLGKQYFVEIDDQIFAEFPFDKLDLKSPGYKSSLEANKGYLFGVENDKCYCISIKPGKEAPVRRNPLLSFGKETPALFCYLRAVEGRYLEEHSKAAGLDFEITRLGPKPLKIYEESGKTLFTL